MKSTIPVAAYLRMSDDKQETSIADQRKELTAFAAKRGFRIVKWFIDEGISGWKSKQRLEFQNLINAAESGQFKVVICWDQARFSRFDPMEANYYWHRLRVAGVTIETVKEGKIDWDSLGGWLSASVHQHAKAEYVRSLAHDVARGLRTFLLAGNWSGAVPFGFRVVNKKLVPGDQHQIALINRIFELRASGLGMRRICNILNAENILSPQGKTWCPHQVNGMLKRQIYIGNMALGREGKGKFVKVFETEQLLENTHQPIVSRELWNRVQAVNSGRGRKVKRGRVASAGGHLSGLLRCSLCGSPLYAETVRRQYVCARYASGRGCAHNWISGDIALSLIAEHVRKTLLKGSVDGLAKEIQRQLDKQNRSTAVPNKKAIMQEIAKVERKLATAAERLLMIDESLLPSAQIAMRKLQTERENLVDELQACSKPSRALTAREIADQLWTLDTELRNGAPQAVRAALSQFIDHIEVEFTPNPLKKDRKRNRFFPTKMTIHYCAESITPVDRSGRT